MKEESNRGGYEWFQEVRLEITQSMLIYSGLQGPGFNGWFLAQTEEMNFNGKIPE